MNKSGQGEGAIIRRSTAPRAITGHLAVGATPHALTSFIGESSVASYPDFNPPASTDLNYRATAVDAERESVPGAAALYTSNNEVVPSPLPGRETF